MRLALGVVALLLALLDFLATPVARAQSVTLRLGLPISLDSPTGQNMREFARQVQARTSGALKVEVEGAGGRYEESEVLPAVKTGADSPSSPRTCRSARRSCSRSCSTSIP